MLRRLSYPASCRVTVHSLRIGATGCAIVAEPVQHRAHVAVFRRQFVSMQQPTSVTTTTTTTTAVTSSPSSSTLPPVPTTALPPLQRQHPAPTASSSSLAGGGGVPSFSGVQVIHTSPSSFQQKCHGHETSASASPSVAAGVSSSPPAHDGASVPCGAAAATVSISSPLPPATNIGSMPDKQQQHPNTSVDVAAGTPPPPPPTQLRFDPTRGVHSHHHAKTECDKSNYYSDGDDALDPMRVIRTSKVRSAADDSFSCAVPLSVSDIDMRWTLIPSTLATLGNVTKSYQLTPFHDTGDAYLKMWEAVDNAKRTITWHTYIAKDDVIGQRTIEKLTAAVKRGVKVEFLYDCGGNMTGRSRLVEPLVAAGATVIRYRPFLPGFLTYALKGLHWHWSPGVRNHRKILVVDDSIGFTGGLNIGCEYAGQKAGGSGKFRDSHCMVSGTEGVRMLKEACADTVQPKPGAIARVLRWRQWAARVVRFRAAAAAYSSAASSPTGDGSGTAGATSTTGVPSTSAAGFRSRAKAFWQQQRARMYDTLANRFETARSLRWAPTSRTQTSKQNEDGDVDSSKKNSSTGTGDNGTGNTTKLRTLLRSRMMRLSKQSILRKRTGRRSSFKIAWQRLRRGMKLNPAAAATTTSSSTTSTSPTATEQQQPKPGLSSASSSSTSAMPTLFRQGLRKATAAVFQRRKDALMRFQQRVTAGNTAESRAAQEFAKAVSAERFVCGKDSPHLSSSAIARWQAAPRFVEVPDRIGNIHKIAIPSDKKLFAQVLLANPLSENWSLQMALWFVVRRSACRLWVTTPYFLPHRKLVTATIEAARRGVDVRILTGSRGTTDPWFMWYAQQYLSHRLLKAGVKLYEYQGGAVMHAKTVVIDGVWSSVGSYNWDILSNKLMEASVTALDPSVAATMEDHFALDLAKSEHIVEDTFLQRSFLVRTMCCFVYYGLKLAESLSFLGYGDRDLKSVE